MFFTFIAMWMGKKGFNLTNSLFCLPYLSPNGACLRYQNISIAKLYQIFLVKLHSILLSIFFQVSRIGSPKLEATFDAIVETFSFLNKNGDGKLKKKGSDSGIEWSLSRR